MGQAFSHERAIADELAQDRLHGHTLSPAPTRSQQFEAELGISPALATASMAFATTYTVAVFSAGFVIGTMLLP